MVREKAKLIHKKKSILPSMRVARNAFQLANGLMFAGKKKVSQGMCLVMPTKEDVRFGASITMWFCFSDMEIIFVNTKFKVVDKVTLKTWVSTYVPKEKCKYVIESTVGKFKDINVGDTVKLDFTLQERTK
jgi:uncharacterized membrane protein (UPF0127 family)